MRHEVEQVWTTAAGLVAVCLKVGFDDASWHHRCGYVGVPKDHRLYEVDYDEERVNDIEVHGGLTFSDGGPAYPVARRDIWWFGFDCAHYMDGEIDPGALRYFAQPDYPAKTEAFVVNQCESLARQLNKRKETSC